MFFHLTVRNIGIRKIRHSSKRYGCACGCVRLPIHIETFVGTSQYFPIISLETMPKFLIWNLFSFRLIRFNLTLIGLASVLVYTIHTHSPCRLLLLLNHKWHVWRMTKIRFNASITNLFTFIVSFNDFVRSFFFHYFEKNRFSFAVILRSSNRLQGYVYLKLIHFTLFILFGS